jgi:tRNA(adenine34) deaminase
MCAGAVVLSRIKLVVYGTKDPKTGACGSMTSLLQHEKHNHKVEVENGVLEEECGDILKKFFKGKRLKRN